MRFSRLVFWPSAGVFGLFLLCILGNFGCGGPVVKAKKVKTFNCGNEIDITVDLHKKNGVDQQAIYVCDQDPVVWKKADGITNFSVHFIDACPFTSCASDITDSTPQTAATQPTELTVYKYDLYINGSKVSDPHVVGGGGY